MKKIFRTSVTVALALVTTTLQAQQEVPQLPVDSLVRFGQLENGLTYYIRHNEQPKERCEFHIAQAVGAILEEDNQNGLAHFLEHMAFNGTEHFKEKGIINYFESLGVNFGGNINAYTSLDETVYRLSEVPTYRDGIIDSALLVMHDWSCALLLDGNEIDAERGVIREEWRTGANANRRMWKESNFNKYPKSQYAKRDVIGDTAVINNFSYEALRNYYHKWYGPDLQAIVVVGDIDVDAIEEKIKALWSQVPARKNRGERPVYEIADNKNPIISIVTDAEAQQTRLELEYKHNPIPDHLKTSIVGYVQDIANELISTILNYRFDEITQKPSASFVAAYGYYGELVKSKDAFQLLSIPKEGQEKEGLKDLLLEAEKVKRFGFTNAELERAKADLLKNYEKVYNERNNLKNRDLTQEYIRHFLDKNPIPGIEWEYQTVQSLLPQLNLASINQIAQNYVSDENLIISLLAPEKENVKLPSKEEILTILSEVKAFALEAPKEEVLNKPLVKKTPKAGKIKNLQKNESLGTTEWTLKNGVKVVFKPTTFKKDEILMSAYSKGGISKIQRIEDLPSAMFATDIVASNGLGDFSAIELQKTLSGKIANAKPFIQNYTEGFSGNSSVKDFETMLQLIYLHFTSIHKDDDGFNSMIDMYKTFLANKENNPKSIFSDSIQMTTSNHHPRTVLFNTETVENIDQEKALALFKERFAAPADFTFTFTGNIDPNDEKTKKAVCTWLGGLKSKKETEDYTDNGIRAPKGELKNYFNRDMQIKTASNRIQYSGEMAFNLKNDLNMDAIGRILDIRYLESIREKEGGSYGVGVYGTVRDLPVSNAVLLMQFDTDPAKQSKLMEIIHKEVSDIANQGPRADDLQKVKESMLKDFAEELEQNNWWDDTALYNYYMKGVDYKKDFKSAVEAITAESVQNTLKQLIDQNNRFEVVMMPK